ncbi:MAG TPA: hypothetical protein VF710_09420 [Longimicrobium sp.]
MAYREFTDDGGNFWRAWDTYPGSAANVRPGFEGGWLGFECEAERRRLAPVPAGWEEASDDDLRSMLARAQPNRPARATPADEAPEAAVPAPADPPPPAGDGVSRSRAVLERVRSVLSAVDRTLRG